MVIVVVAIMATELAIMLVFTLPFMSQFSSLVLTIMDALILGLILTPIVYRFLMSPLRDHVIHEQRKFYEMQDELTGLPSRKLFMELVEQEMKLATRNSWIMALFVIDPHGLSEINQIFGYAFGDKVLIEMASRLKSLLRKSDIISRISGDEFGMLMQQVDEGSVSPARSSGDEFGILLQHLDAKAIKPVIQRISETLETPFHIDGISVDIGVTIGVSIHPYHGDNTSLLLQRARMALSTARKNLMPYSVFEQEYESQAEDRIRLFGEIRRAIVQNEFELYYQPKVHIPTSRVIGAEALIRLNNGSTNDVSRLISFAEQVGIITDITHWVLRKAVQQLSLWQDQGLSVNISINVSVHDVLNEKLAEDLLGLCREYSVEPSRITIEITESAIMRQARKAIAILAHMRKTGLRISIDDFGTGYSSLSYLRMLPADELKIDQSFIRVEEGNRKDDVLVALIIDIGNKMGLNVIAEGIETQAQLDRIQRLGCDTVQGYLISHPLPPDELVRWHRHWTETHG